MSSVHVFYFSLSSFVPAFWQEDEVSNSESAAEYLAGAVKHISPELVVPTAGALLRQAGVPIVSAKVRFCEAVKFTISCYGQFTGERVAERFNSRLACVTGKQSPHILLLSVFPDLAIPAGCPCRFCLSVTLARSFVEHETRELKPIPCKTAVKARSLVCLPNT